MAYVTQTWTDRVTQFSNRYLLMTNSGSGKNIAAPFHLWKALAAGSSVMDDFTMSVTGNAGGYITVQYDATAVAGQTYTFSSYYNISSYTSGTGITVEIGYVNSAGSYNNKVASYVTTGSGRLSVSLAAPSTAVTVRVKVIVHSTSILTVSWTNPMLEAGTTASTYEPPRLAELIYSGGLITDTGSPVNATRMNNIEQGIASAVPLGANSREVANVQSVIHETDNRTTSIIRDSSGSVLSILESDPTVNGVFYNNFVGKVSGSGVEVPHIIKSYVTSTALQPPNPTTQNGIQQNSYDSTMALDGTAYGGSQTTTNGIIPHTIFSFDIVTMFERALGISLGSTLPEKIAWLKANIIETRCNWYGYAVCPSGYRNLMNLWSVTSSNWTSYATVVGTNSTTALRSKYTGTPKDAIDSLGYIHFIVYTDASDGVTTSQIRTDYVEVQMTLGYTPVRTTSISRSNGYVSGVSQFAGGKTVAMNIARNGSNAVTGITKTVV